MTELYEDLPGGDLINEELYEDLPDSAYSTDNSVFSNGRSNQFQGSQVQYQQQQQQGERAPPPPPLPTSSIPQSRPGGPPPLVSKSSGNFPPIPTRSPSTQLTSGKAAPQDKKKGKELKKKPTPLKPSNSSKGGVNLDEILQKAKARRPIEDLEKNFKDEDTDEEKHVVPWANQLRKTNGGRHMTSERPEKDGVPEFIRKARTLSIHEEGTEHLKKQPQGPQTLPRKPTTSSPSHKPTPNLPFSAKSHDNFPPVPPKSVEDKPEHRVLPQGGGVRTTPKPVRPAPIKPSAAEGKSLVSSKPASPGPSSRPSVSFRPSPLHAGKPAPTPPVAAAGRVSNGEVRGKNPVPPPQVLKALKPMPSPRHLAGNNVQTAEEMDHTSIPQPSSFSNRELADTEMRSTLASAVSSASTTNPPLSKSPRIKATPPPKPIRHDSNLQDLLPAVPKRKSSFPLPPQEENRPSLIPARTASTSPMPPETQPNPVEFKPPPPPPKTSPPPPSTLSSTSITSSQLPHIPGKPPIKLPPQPPFSLGQPTPLMGSVMKFRRLPLPPVDLANPPPLPSRDAKGTSGHTVMSGGFEDQDIYDDTADLNANRVIEEDLYDDVSVAILLPGSQSPAKQTSAGDIVEESQVNGVLEPGKPEEETYEDLSLLQPPSHSPTFLPSSTSSPSIPSPTPVQGRLSPTYSPSVTLKRTKEDRKKQEKMEKEIRKKNEAKLKNKQKGLRAHKQFNLTIDVRPLFTVEMLLDHNKTKDHLQCSTGEVVFVLLIAHEKMSSDKYFVEKEDGSIGFVKKCITQRINYRDPQSILSQAAPPLPQSGGAEGGAYPEPEDIYESLPQGDTDFSSFPNPPLPSFPNPPLPSFPNPPLPSFPNPPLPSQAIPSLPPPNVESHPPGNFRFPAPMVAPPPPPPPENGPEETYEYLPEEQ